MRGFDEVRGGEETLVGGPRTSLSIGELEVEPESSGSGLNVVQEVLVLNPCDDGTRNAHWADQLAKSSVLTRITNDGKLAAVPKFCDIVRGVACSEILLCVSTARMLE